MNSELIRVLDACKNYGAVTALDHVNASFEKGLIHGIVGRNGSGKTVLFKCICGFTPLTSGEILVNGSAVKNGNLPVLSGIIIETPGFLETRSGYDNLRLLASVRGEITKEKIRDTMRLVGLDPSDKKHVSKYSMGMRQRLAIAQAIMEEPVLLVLDEPMNGLDRQGVNDIRKLLLMLKNGGKTILLASHHTEDINMLCDTVCEMDCGRLERIR